MTSGFKKWNFKGINGFFVRFSIEWRRKCSVTGCLLKLESHCEILDYHWPSQNVSHDILVSYWMDSDFYHSIGWTISGNAKNAKKQQLEFNDNNNNKEVMLVRKKSELCIPSYAMHFWDTNKCFEPKNTESKWRKSCIVTFWKYGPKIPTSCLMVVVWLVVMWCVPAWSGFDKPNRFTLTAIK